MLALVQLAVKHLESGQLPLTQQFLLRHFRLAIRRPFLERSRRREMEDRRIALSTPPDTPLLAGRPMENAHSPEKSYMPQEFMTVRISRTYWVS